MIKMIWAEDDNGIIGNSKTNDLPWPKIPEDFSYVSKVTTDQVIVMGHLTFLSFPNGPLKNRVNVVLTSGKITNDNVETIKDISDIKLIQKKYPQKDIFIFGGQRVFSAGLPYADELYQTKIHGSYQGDIKIPVIDFTKYEKIRGKEVLSKTGIKLTFNIFKKLSI